MSTPPDSPEWRHGRSPAPAADDPPTRPFGRITEAGPPPPTPAPAAAPAEDEGVGVPGDGSDAHGDHGHGHGPASPAGRRVRILLAALLVPAAIATLVGLVLLWPSGPAATASSPAALTRPVRAQVTETRATPCDPNAAPASVGPAGRSCVGVVVHMTDGPRAGRDLVQIVPREPGTPVFAVGDAVVLGWSGGNPDDPGSYQIVDFQRGTALGWLAALFAAAVLVLGRWRGLAALVALVLSFGVLLVFVLPSILAGHDPLWVAVIGSCDRRAHV